MILFSDLMGSLTGLGTAKIIPQSALGVRFALPRVRVPGLGSGTVT